MNACERSLCLTKLCLPFITLFLNRNQRSTYFKLRVGWTQGVVPGRAGPRSTAAGSWVGRRVAPGGERSGSSDRTGGGWHGTVRAPGRARCAASGAHYCATSSPWRTRRAAPACATATPRRTGTSPSRRWAGETSCRRPCVVSPPSAARSRGELQESARVVWGHPRANSWSLLTSPRQLAESRARSADPERTVGGSTAPGGVCRGAQGGTNAWRPRVSPRQESAVEQTDS